MSDRPIAIVLPHRERFGPGQAGAIAMVVRCLARAPTTTPAIVLGPAFDGAPFPDVPFHPLRSPAWLGGRWGYAAAAAIALRRIRPAAVEIHNKPDLARFLARACPEVPVSLFLHNDPRSMRGARSPAARARLARRLAGIAAVSPFLRDLWREGLDGAQAPAVIPNAIDPSALPRPRASGERERLILFAGRVVADKGADAFVDVCARVLPALPGWRAEMIGADGFSRGGRETPFIRALRPRAEAAGVAMLGYQPHDTVLAAMAKAAIVVVPSRWEEPFGLTALEAMGCGAALACSLRGGLAHVAGDAAARFDPDDREGAAAALLALACDAERRAELGARGRARASALFAPEIAWQALAALRGTISAGRR